MKKLAVFLIVAMLFTLCACNGDNAQPTEPSESVTQSTDATDTTEVTDATNDTNATNATDATDATIDATDATTESTEATKATEAPTEPSVPETTACSHSWKDATCTAPKTCTKCGETSGKAADHSWKAATCTAPKTCSKCGKTEGAALDHSYADGVCTGCGAEAPKSAYDEFVEGVWKCEVVKPATADTCETYFVVTYDPGWGFGYSYKTYFSELPESEGGDDDGEEQQYFGTVEYNGKTYYDLTFSGSMGGWEVEAIDNGNLKIEMMNDVTLEVKRDAPGKFSVVSINDTNFLPIGAVLNKTRDVEAE